MSMRSNGVIFVTRNLNADAAHLHSSRMDGELRGAIRESFLANLAEDVVAALVDGAVRVHAPAGTRLSRSDGRPSVKLVANGLLRIVRTVADGRTITQRFLRRGDVAGIAMVFSSREGRATGAFDAIMDSVVYQLSGEAWRSAALRDAQVAVAMLSDLGRVAEDSMEHMVNRALASMRQRVVGQLLDAAEGPDVVAPVTQQQLADGIGSAREVVARVLHELREEKLVATRVGSIVLLDPERLRLELAAS
jgi:CRP/FNR family cyclic AMP-dependent transcriptional regulator